MDLPLYVLNCTTSGNAGMKEGDRELIACDDICAVAAYQSKMLRERARPLRMSAEEKDLTKLEAELQELEIRKFQLDADDAEITNWRVQLSKCMGKLNKMHYLDHDGESRSPSPPPTSPYHSVLCRTAHAT